MDRIIRHSLSAECQSFMFTVLILYFRLQFLAFLGRGHYRYLCYLLAHLQATK
jgi:hypothetical protein